jgi:hypothetical protein
MDFRDASRAETRMGWQTQARNRADRELTSRYRGLVTEKGD